MCRESGRKLRSCASLVGVDKVALEVWEVGLLSVEGMTREFEDLSVSRKMRMKRHDHRESTKRETVVRKLRALVGTIGRIVTTAIEDSTMKDTAKQKVKTVKRSQRTWKICDSDYEKTVRVREDVNETEDFMV